VQRQTILPPHGRHPATPVQAVGNCSPRRSSSRSCCIKSKSGTCSTPPAIEKTALALLTGADYEYAPHVPDFLTAGGSQAEIDALNRFISAHPRGVVADAALGSDESAVIEYAVQVTLDVRVSDAVFAKMKARFDTTQIVEITTAIAAYNMVARMLVPLGVTAKDG
jgi:hypothetical protein